VTSEARKVSFNRARNDFDDAFSNPPMLLNTVGSLVQNAKVVFVGPVLGDQRQTVEDCVGKVFEQRQDEIVEEIFFAFASSAIASLESQHEEVCDCDYSVIQDHSRKLLYASGYRFLQPNW
jgi:hypothetical protein